jgi:hypothetical protein
VKSSIEVSAQFDFKGETFRPSVTIDLDRQMMRHGELPEPHQLLAKTNQIDPYSYQYEVLESSELTYANATGLAAGFLQQGHFDSEGFQRQWLVQRELSVVEEIAQRHLGAEALAQQPALRAALLEAYEAGREGR